MLDDDPKIEVVKVGDSYYLVDEWVAAFNTVFLETLDSRIRSGTTERQLMRSVRGLKTEAAARANLNKAIKRISSAGNALTLEPGMEVVATFPGLSDPAGMVG